MIRKATRIKQIREFASSWDVAKIYIVTGRGGVYLKDVLTDLISIIDTQQKEIKSLKRKIDKLNHLL